MCNHPFNPCCECFCGVSKWMLTRLLIFKRFRIVLAARGKGLKSEAYIFCTLDSEGIHPRPPIYTLHTAIKIPLILASYLLILLGFLVFPYFSSPFFSFAFLLLFVLLVCLLLVSPFLVSCPFVLFYHPACLWLSVVRPVYDVFCLAHTFPYHRFLCGR